jgi:hypothetical protein
MIRSDVLQGCGATEEEALRKLKEQVKHAMLREGAEIKSAPSWVPRLENVPPEIKEIHNGKPIYKERVSPPYCVTQTVIYTTAT